jgi:hypothetical protein
MEIRFHFRDTTFLVDQNVIDVANLVIGRIIDILLVKIRHWCRLAAE